jgi:pimeloyl-ACP methyl ester carboxylesterase
LFPSLPALVARSVLKHPEQEARTLAEHLPHSSVQLMEGAGHHLQVEVPEQTAQRILAFFAAVEQKPAFSKGGQ